ncbi:hypothetical protein PV05_09109 [Exophiala xenobiotica]|uniref:Uncharacterized protein n=1 Tax=Exophiala xenobiotica TaxID=348802 RepID=A0A0D2F0R6_9EURO|nr:uncharacterized protein PV05_09109 [Exophiala xenobiotica]KIW53549.1 hypothetical protein PV05_09109 [Exophiala xenobiotica]
MVSQEGIILICIVSAAVTVVLGYSVHRLFFRFSGEENKLRKPSEEQLQYMREVRDRNRMLAYMDARGTGDQDASKGKQQY